MAKVCDDELWIILCNEIIKGLVGGLERGIALEFLRDMALRLDPDQDVHSFYMRSHFSALQNCALLFPTNFQFIFIFKNI